MLRLVFPCASHFSRMPLVAKVRYGNHLWKGYGPFDEKRALGLGWEACVKKLRSSHTLDAAPIRLRPDQNGPLQTFTHGSWVDRHAVDVQLLPEDQEFIQAQVQQDFRLLASVDFWPQEVDVPVRVGRATIANGSHDLLGCFFSGTPLSGKVALERKFMFQDTNRSKEVALIKKRARDQFSARRDADTELKGQLLLITAVFRRKSMWTGLYLTSGGNWKTLAETQNNALLQLSGQEIRFEKAWSKFKKCIVNCEEHVEVSHFLEHLGIRRKDVSDKIDAWTRGSRGSLTKGQHFIKHEASLKRGSSPWIASKAVLLTVWLQLNH